MVNVFQDDTSQNLYLHLLIKLIDKAALVIETSNQKVLKLISELAKQLGATITIKKAEKTINCKLDHTPNAETIKAINATKAGKVKKITDLDAFFEAL